MGYLTILMALLPLLFIDHSSSNQTESLVLQDGLLSRRIRALIFPNKAAVLLTAAMTKIIVGGRPGGLQYSLEFDMYVPLPDTVEGWRPNILIGPTTKKPSVVKPKRRWDGSWQRYVKNNQFQHRQSISYQGPYQADSYTKYNQAKTPKDYFYKSPWQLTEEPWQRQPQSDEDDGEVYASWSDEPRWKLNRGYRERREIFDQLEAMGKFFQLDFRSCIKRAMCELQARFNEQYQRGLLMEDLLRIVLTVPEDIPDDKYQHRVKGRDCARFYAVSCPYPVLDFLTQKSKTK